VTDRATELEGALAERVASVAPYLLPSGPPPSEQDTGALLDRLVARVAADRDPAPMWALLAAVCAAYPTRDDMDRVRRRLQLADPEPLTLAFLEAAHPLAAQGDISARAEVVPGAVLVDVDFTAKHDLNSGIQRVCRSLLPIWAAEHDVVPVVWNLEASALRRLTRAEEDRVLRWGEEPRSSTVSAAATADRPGTFLVPWDAVVVVMESTGGDLADRLAGLGDRSGSRLVAVVYDAIPVVSSDLVLSYVATGFVRYLAAIKFARRLAAISETAAEEFRGFVQSLPVQGLTGPEVIAVPLGGDAAPVVPAAPSTVPMILAVGSHEPRKNHLTVLHCADLLWREGLVFSLQFIGAGGWGDAFPERVGELRRAGRPVVVRQAVTEAELDEAYASAAFTVFPSLHEGYGLPVIESLSHGTPAVTSGFGSMREVAEPGGVVTVDPRDSDALAGVMRRLLTEPEALAALRAEISARPGRDWRDYADELWERLVRPELSGEPPARAAVHAAATVGG
jgi:glycosyltransferase involved in cell wall biosynthesis